jgi:FAD/FMN-containing dehydrogenase
MTQGVNNSDNTSKLSTKTWHAAANAKELRSRIAGPVFEREDQGLAAEVACFNTVFSHTPDIVVGATCEADVTEAVRYAAREGLKVFVQTTGHGASAPLTCGLLITLWRLNGVRVDRRSRLATIEGGASWEPVIAAASEHGLVPVTGSSTSVGAVGYTLGGGFGPLCRTCGCTSDWVRAFRVVVAAGEVITASASENSELFWALRGGKAGLGIVTSMDVELLPEPTLYGGGLFFSAANCERVLAAWVEWTRSVPESVTSSVALIRMPDSDRVPFVLRGQYVLHLRYVCVGSASEGERLLAPLREQVPVLVDGVDVLPAVDIATVHQDPQESGPNWHKGMLLDRVDQAFVTALLATVGPETMSPFRGVEIRRLGGAVSRDVPEGSAVSGRSAGYTLALIGIPEPEGPHVDFDAYAQMVTDAIGPWVSSQANINFTGFITTIQDFELVWPHVTGERLTRIRQRYDPQELFSLVSQ